MFEMLFKVSNGTGKVGRIPSAIILIRMGVLSSTSIRLIRTLVIFFWRVEGFFFLSVRFVCSIAVNYGRRLVRIFPIKHSNICPSIFRIFSRIYRLSTFEDVGGRLVGRNVSSGLINELVVVGMVGSISVKGVGFPCINWFSFIRND